jgi:hypothetical protein
MTSILSELWTHQHWLIRTCFVALGGKHMPQWPFVFRKFHMSRPGFESGTPRSSVSVIGRPIGYILF